MLFRTTAAAAALAFAIATPLAAQESAPIAPVAAVSIAPSTQAILRAGTPVSLRLMETVTTKEKAARVGQRVRMEIASPVEYNGVVVIPAGTPAEGEVTEVRNKGMWGKSGHLTARALWARVGGRQIRLAGSFDDKGVTGTGGVVASIALVPLAGFFVTGTSATLPQGGQVGAFLDEDIPLAINATTPPPLEVQTTAPMVVQQALTAAPH